MKIKPTNAVVLTGALLGSTSLMADAVGVNPFEAREISGYALTIDQQKEAESKCGAEGGCGQETPVEGADGEDKAPAKKMEGGCGEGKCGAH